MKQEPLFKYRFNEIYDHVLYYPIEEGQSHYDPFFRLPYFENPVFSRLIRSVLQNFDRVKQIVFAVRFKLQNVRPVPFALSGLVICFQGVRESADLVYQIFNCLNFALPHFVPLSPTFRRCCFAFVRFLPERERPFSRLCKPSDYIL